MSYLNLRRFFWGAANTVREPCTPCSRWGSSNHPQPNRHTEPWRLFYGRVGLLDFYLDIFNKYRQGDEWDTPALKLIGNCCVDYGITPAMMWSSKLLIAKTDENRDRVLAKLDLSILIKAFRSPQLAPLPLIALYSICRDYGTHSRSSLFLATYESQIPPKEL